MISGRILLSLLCALALTCGSKTSEHAHTEGYYTCPMHPQIHQDHPGECPICHMQLVFKPGKFQAEATTQVEAESWTVQAESLVVPRTLLVPLTSVLDSGKRKIVFIKTEENSFSPRQVDVIRQGSNFRILGKIKPGEIIASDAQFLLDSETNLNARMAKP